MTIRQQKIAGERGMGGKRVIRKSISLTNDLDTKSKQLATSCNMSQAELLYTILEMALNSAPTVQYLQKQHNTNSKYEVIPIKVGNKLHYQ